MKTDPKNVGWFRKIVSYMTRMIEWCTRKLHNVVSNKDNQITWEWDQPVTPQHASAQFQAYSIKTVIHESIDEDDLLNFDGIEMFYY